MAKKTSFEEAERQQKTLIDLMKESGEDVEREPVVEEPESQEPEQEVAGEQEAQGTEAPVISPFVQRLRESGYDVSDNIPEEDLQASVVERLKAQRELEKEIARERQEREKLLKELEEARKAMESSKTPQPEPEPQKPVVNPWAPIQDFDQELLKYVEQDPNTGLWRAREEYADFGGKEAADKVNEHYKIVRQRSQALVKDPIGVLWNNGLKDQVDKMVEERAKALLEDRLKSYDSKLRSASTAAYERRAQEDAKAQRMEKFWSEVGDKIVKLDANGNPLYDLSGNAILTDFGRAYQSEVAYLRDELGVQDEEKLHTTAWRNLSHRLPQQQAQPEVPAQQEQPAPQKPEETGKQKRARFVERRTSTQPAAPADRSGYQPVAQEKPTFTGRLSLRDLVEEEDALS